MVYDTTLLLGDPERGLRAKSLGKDAELRRDGGHERVRQDAAADLGQAELWAGAVEQVHIGRAASGLACPAKRLFLMFALTRRIGEDSVRLSIIAPKETAVHSGLHFIKLLSH